MPQPTGSDMFVSTLLTRALVGWQQAQEKFVATQVFPPVPVELQGGIVPQYKIGDLYRVTAPLRAAGTEAVEIGWNTDNTLAYFAQERAFKHLIPDPIRGTTQNPYDQDRDATIIVGQMARLKLESDWMTTFFTTSIWSRDWTGQNTADSTHKIFWDASGSTPVEDITQEMDHIESLTGYRPNVLVLGPSVYTALRNNAEVIDRVKYGGTPGDPAVIDLAALAQLFGVSKVLRASAVTNTAAEGATDSISFLAGKSALLCYAAPAPSIFQPSAGYTFPWTNVYGASGDMAFRVKKYRWEIKEGDYVEAQSFYDMKQIASSLGTFFSAITVN